MTDLDDFVARARSENAQHHDQHSEAVAELSSTVGASFSNISSHYKGTFSRVQDLGTDMDANVERLQGGLEPLDDTVCQPLGKLRKDISATDIREYEPTGETPEKVQYQYPTKLPQTASYDAIIAGMRDGADAQTPSRPTPSPSKRTPAPQPQVFNDLDSSEQARSPTRPTSSDSGTVRNPLATSLREVNANLTSNSLMFDPTASPVLVLPPVDENTIPIKKSTSRIPREGKSKKMRLDGVENMPPPELSQSTQRRKSPRRHT